MFFLCSTLRRGHWLRRPFKVQYAIEQINSNKLNRIIIVPNA